MFGVTLLLTLFLFSTTDGAGVPLKISSVLVSPYLMESENSNVTDDSDPNKYEGYIKDLLDLLSQNLNREYEIPIVHTSDGYGSEQADGSWSGMIGDVVSNRVDIGAGPLTRTMPREKVIDFTYPFQSFEAVAVMEKRHWNKKPQINKVEDFFNQNVIKLGIVQDGSMAKYLQQSKLELDKQIWETLRNHSRFMSSNEEGIRRVKWDEDYAFFMESSIAEKIVNKKPCKFVAIPGRFYRRQYAMAVSNQSPLRDTLNDALAELGAQGKLEELQKKWLKGDDCSGSAMIHSSALTIILVLFQVFGKVL